MQIFRKIFSLSAFIGSFDKLHISPNSRRQNVSMWLVRLVCVCVCPRAHADPRSGVRTPLMSTAYYAPTMRLRQRKFLFFFFFIFTRAYICIYKCFLRPLKKKKKRFCRLYNIHIPQVYYIKSSPFEPLFIKISLRLVVRAPRKTLRSCRPCAQFCRTFPATAFARVSLSVSHSF